MSTIILARFPLSSEVLGPRVVHVYEILERDLPLHPETPQPYQTQAFSSTLLNPSYSILEQMGLKTNF